MKLSMQLAISFLILAQISCNTLRVSDIPVSITLPASKDCYQFYVLSRKERRLKAESKECQDLKLRSVWIDFDSYKIMRRDIQVNCQLNQCKQITGAFDDLFFKIDSAIGKMQNLKK